MAAINSFVACLLVAVAVIILWPASSSAQQALGPHTETYTYYVTVSDYNCYSYYYTYCYNYWYWNYWNYGWYGGWYWYRPWYYGNYWNYYYGYYGYWNWCYSYPRSCCYYTYRSVAVTGTRCQAGWIGSQCNVPTCTPSCTDGRVCIDLNKCGCAADGSPTSTCSLTPCSPTNNCYPGTCVSGVCKCPPGFSGPNCIDMSHKPSISSCSVKMYARKVPGADETSVAQADCAAEGLTPSITWIRGDLLNHDVTVTNLGLTKIEPIWTADYTYPNVMPTRPIGSARFYLTSTPVTMGIWDASFTVVFPDNGNFTTGRTQCPYRIDKLAPLTTLNCDVAKTWDSFSVNTYIGHGKTLIVKMAAQLGGQKNGDPQFSYNELPYGFGSQDFNGASVVYQAALKFDLVAPSHCLLTHTPGTDGRVNCSAFPIYLDQDIRTNPVINPLFFDWTDDGSGVKTFHVEVFYMQPDASGQVLEPNGQALTDSVADVTPALNNYHFTVSTSGVYSIILTVYDYAGNSAKARKIFNYMNQASYAVTSSPVFIQEGNPAVNHSFISTLTDWTQVTLVWTGRFQAHELYGRVLSKRVRPLPIDSWTIDDSYGSQFGQRSINAVANATGVSSYTVQYLVDSDGGGVTAVATNNTPTAVVTGETAKLTFNSPLKGGDTIIIWLTTDGSTGNRTVYRLAVGVDTTKVNVSSHSFLKNGVDKYKSRVVLKAVDRQSGINSTQYKIIDSRSGVEVVPSQVAPSIKRDSPNSKRKREATQGPCVPSDTTCYCVPTSQCFAYEQTIDIDNCLIDRFSNADYNLVFKYTTTNMAGIVTTEAILELGDISGIECRTPPGLSGGAIAGIVIGVFFGFIIIVLLICLIVLIIIRLRQHKHPIPSRAEMRTMAGNVRNRLTVKHVNRGEDNAVYASNQQTVSMPSTAKAKQNNAAYVDDEMYVDKDDLDTFKIPKKQVQIGDVLAEGRFAVIRRSYYMKANEKQTVAAKALKNGFSKEDELLMAKKVAYMKNVPHHGNIVNFIGFVDESDGQGPIMILELCEFPLKDWLANLSNVSTDDLEQMLIFTLNIAQGMAHLHNHKLIHRRLAVRNVLLKQQANGLVAKLIGFGPTAEDLDKSDGAGAGVSVPLKWMAPETLDTMNSRQPTYNEKTDAWSFGVTIWEIYSKGAAPYAEVRSADIKGLVKKGERLKCPHECPPDLFNSVVSPCWKENAKQRPTFNVTVQKIQEYRSGSSGPQEGYYGTDEIGGARGDQYASGGEMYSDGR